MDRDRFEARLKAEGYPEIRTNELPPDRRNPEHSHPFDVLALVLEGEIALTVDGETSTYRAGDEFSMKAGCPHIENIGPGERQAHGELAALAGFATSRTGATLA